MVNWLRPRPVGIAADSAAPPILTVSEAGGDDSLHRTLGGPACDRVAHRAALTGCVSVDRKTEAASTRGGQQRTARARAGRARASVG